jgi:Leucine-rich repeat (LRR) protein
MKFNPFAENKIPSVSMFTKERKKQVQATAEAVEDLEASFGTKEYLGVKMDYETRTFFNELVGQIGEELVMKIIEGEYTELNADGGLMSLDCSNTQITSLPELPTGLMELDCGSTLITELPELPAGLTELFCYNTKITSLPKLPTGLTVLVCRNSQITSLPELPVGLEKLFCHEAPFANDMTFIDELRKKHPGLSIVT